MELKYRVYVKATADSSWVFTGTIESNKERANKKWAENIKKWGYHSFKLEYTTAGIAVE